MHLQEFKAWFEGYTEAMKGAPTEKQWARIKEQVKKIDGPWQYYSWPMYNPPRYTIPAVWYSNNAGGGSMSETVTAGSGIETTINAAYAAGRADAKDAA